MFKDFKESEHQNQPHPPNPNKHDIPTFIWLQMYACIHPHNDENQELLALKKFSNNEMCVDSAGREKI